jgi:glycosidase
MSEPGASVRGLRLAFTFLMTARGTPLVYYGDEIGMPGGDDPDNRRDFPGGWRDDARNAFADAGRSPDEQGVFAHLRRLLHLRAELSPLRRGSMANLALGEHSWAYARLAGGQAVVVFLNNGGAAAEIDAPAPPAAFAEGALLEDRLEAAPPLRVAGGRLRVSLPGWSGAIYTAKAAPNP